MIFTLFGDYIIYKRTDEFIEENATILKVSGRQAKKSLYFFDLAKEDLQDKVDFLCLLTLTRGESGTLKLIAMTDLFSVIIAV